MKKIFFVLGLLVSLIAGAQTPPIDYIKQNSNIGNNRGFSVFTFHHPAGGTATLNNGWSRQGASFYDSTGADSGFYVYGSGGVFQRLARATESGVPTDGDKGDLTISSTGTVWTIDNGVVSLAKMANVATARIFGRVSASTGVPEALTGTQATTLLDAFTSSLKGLAPASGGGTTNFLRADGTWAAPPGGGGISDGDKTDITVSASGATWTVDNDAISYAKMQNISATDRILGRIVSGGDPEELTGTQVNTMLPVFTSALKGSTPASGGGTDNFLRADGTWVNPPGDPITDGDKGDITISSTSTIFKVDSLLRPLYPNKLELAESSSSVVNAAWTRKNNDAVLAEWWDGGQILFHPDTLFTGGMWKTGPTVSNKIHYSVDEGATWVEYVGTLPMAMHTFAYTYMNGYHYIAGSDYLATTAQQKTVWRSPDLINWIVMTSDYGGSPRLLGSLIHDEIGNLYWLGGQSGLDAGTGLNDIWKSSNFGTTWTQIATSISVGGYAFLGMNNSNNIKYFNGRVVRFPGGVHDDDTPGDNTYDKRIYSADIRNLANGSSAWRREVDLDIPAGVQYISVGLWDGKMWGYGGYNGSANTNNVAFYDKSGASRSFANYTGATTGTSLVVTHASAFGAFRDKLYTVLGNVNNSCFQLARTTITEAFTVRDGTVDVKGTVLIGGTTDAANRGTLQVAGAITGKGDGFTGDASPTFYLTNNTAARTWGWNVDNTGLMQFYDLTAGTATRFQIDATGDALFYQNLSVTDIPNASSDLDRFLVSNSGTLNYRTGTQLVGDLEAELDLQYIPNDGASNAWSETVQGLTRGTIHFRPQATTNHGNAITWGAMHSGTTIEQAQAGIYVRTSSSFGTRMYLSTTDDFGPGSQTAVTIFENGALRFNRITGSGDEMLVIEADGDIKRQAIPAGTVTSVSGTTDRITSTGGATPVIDISATFEALLGKVANPLSQFAATTSAQLAGVISDESGSGALIFGTAPTISGIVASNTFRLSTIASPAQLTADVNDYNPSATSTIFRLSSDALRNITGWAAGTDGQVIILLNVGSNDIVLQNEDAGSSAANRFSMKNDFTISSGVMLTYDGTSQRWRVVSF